MEVREAISKKWALEREIENLLGKFTEETGIFITDVQTETITVSDPIKKLYTISTKIKF